MNKNTKNYLKIPIISCMAVFLLTGCAVKQMELTESGFLSGYSGLVEDAEYKGLKVYKNPDVNIKAEYSKILIAPVKFKLDPMVKEHELDFEDRRKLSNYFHEKLIEGLIEDYELLL